MKPHAHDPVRRDPDGREHVGDLVPPVGVGDGDDDHVAQLIATVEEDDLVVGNGDDVAAPEVSALHIELHDDVDDDD